MSTVFTPVVLLFVALYVTYGNSLSIQDDSLSAKGEYRPGQIATARCLSCFMGYGQNGQKPYQETLNSITSILAQIVNTLAIMNAQINTESPTTPLTMTNNTRPFPTPRCVNWMKDMGKIVLDTFSNVADSISKLFKEQAQQLKSTAQEATNILN